MGASGAMPPVYPQPAPASRQPAPSAVPAAAPPVVNVAVHTPPTRPASHLIAAGGAVGFALTAIARALGF